MTAEAEKYLRGTRHDTCGKFCWVTERTITEDQIRLLGRIPGVPETIRVQCGRAFNSYALAQGYVRDAKRACAAAINNAKHVERA